MLYHLRQALQAARANLTAALGTLATMTLTLTLLGLVTLITLNLERIVRGIERDVQITAFLAPAQNAQDAETRLKEIEAQIAKVTDFESQRFISREEAYSNLTVDFPYLAEAKRVVENPLRDRIQIELATARNVKAVADRVRSIPGVEEVESGEGFVDNVLNALNAIRGFGYGLVLILALNSLFNILNTIRMAMYARRDEINVMRLIGATRGFIRTPYVLEGVGLGALASLFTLLIVYPIYTQGVGRIQTLVPFLELIREPVVVLQVLALLTVLGVGLGLMGSLFATNRYLREVE